MTRKKKQSTPIYILKTFNVSLKVFILMELDSGRGVENNIKEKFGSSSTSSSYSIGVNSDDESGDNEAESPYKGPLDMMESLEEVLPIRFEFVSDSLMSEY